ncbi:carboxylesterase/lipase family protein [Aestuariimicrobium ganziense]|uniref:carboxylesterase/lipase family protein n=1 Tax=Aestuariimicrobium ganziense TaxID=2773677 RepID=UPI00194395DC|nr:carboxylesterase family protein [Aestuariimicrobium ganziense]
MSDSPVVTTTSGQVRGFWRDQPEGSRSAAFLGVPFAEAPVGAYRYLAPHPRTPWEGVRDATKYGATAQRRPFGEVTAIPEPSIPGDDVLHVNVFTPDPREGALLPVLFWIHGGGYKAGSPASPWYDGFAFNRDGVVTVSVGYRLGFDGFGLIEHAPANRGLLDQIAGLEWVRNNIAEFGGDPSNVTIAGQSAGGGSVLALMASPLAEGLFHAAISHSGALRPITADLAAERTTALAEQLGVEPTVEGFSSVTHDQVLDATEAMERAERPVEDPQQVVDSVVAAERITELMFLPHEDSFSLPAGWVSRVAAHPAPLMFGTTAHEITAAGQFMAPLLQGQNARDLLRTSRLGEFAEEYLAANAEMDDDLLLGQVDTDKTFRRWVPVVAQAREQHGLPTWVYDFRWVNQTSGLATHCAELPFVWDNLADPKVETSSGPGAPQELADRMHAVWVQFISEHTAPWQVWTREAPRTMVFDESSGEADGYQVEARFAEVVERLSQ